MARKQAAASVAVCAELSRPASMPLARSRRTWSCINAISGETTSVSPGSSRAGNWKHSDLPPPVGITASTSRPAMASRMMSIWPGRNSLKPK